MLLDSISSGFYFVDDDDTSAQTLARITVHYQDPDTLGNSQLFYWRSDGNRESFGWGALGYNRFLEGTDDLINGQYVHTTLGNGFTLGEFVEYYMVSVERKVYNFWESYRQARNNEGPFATPVRLASTIQGENVIGCFSGFSVSRKDIIIR